MTKSINNKLAVLCVALAVTFGAVFTAYAYENLEIDVEVLENSTVIEVEYDDENGDEVEKDYVYEGETDLDVVYDLLATELGIDRADVDAAIDDVDEYEEVTLEEAEDAIADAEEEIEKAAVVIADAEADGKETDLSAETLLKARASLESAIVAKDAGDYAVAEEDADEAEDFAKLARMKYIDKTQADIDDEDSEELNDDDDGDEEEGDDEWDDDKTSKFCDNTSQAAGWGVAKKCVDSDDYEVNEKLAKKVERFEDFGKSTDKVVLQGQLQELLLILIQLLQQQMALQSN